jgi:hypothetical protein
MLKRSAILLMVGAVACGPASHVAEGALPDIFVLCDRPLPHALTIELNYRNLTARYWDMGGDVLTCGDTSNCISFPIVFSIPPRLPETNEIVSWSIVGHRFSMTRLPDSPDDYEIAVTGNPRQGGGAFRGEDMRIRYNTRRGIMSYRDVGDQKIWSTCRGRLTFEDLRRLRPQLVPEFRHNPDLRPGQPDDIPDNFQMDANMSLPPRQ